MIHTLALLPRSTMRTPLPVAALLLALPATADVLVVDRDGPGAAYTTIQDAVDAALEGDTVLVRAARDLADRYDGFVVDGKSLVIRGEGRPLVRTGAAAVQNVPVGSEVVLIGMDLNRSTLGEAVLSPPDTSAPGLSITSSQGAVRIVDCSMEGSFGQRMWAGLQLMGALDVTLDGCEVLGATSPRREDTGGSALQSIASRVSLFTTRVVGGEGYTDSSFTAYGSDGGPGLALYARSVVWVADCDVVGGAGGDAECGVYTCDDFPGDGGAGMVVHSGSIVVESRTSFTGGAPGTTGVNSFTPDGAPGPPTVGPYTSDPSTHVEVAVESAFVRESPGGPPVVRVTVFGHPGESARVAVARGGGYRFFGSSRGVLLVSDYASSPAFVPLGVIGTSGSVTADLPLPPLGTSADSRTVFLQAAVDTGPNPSDFRLGAPIAVTLDGSSVPSVFDRTRVHVDAAASPGGDGASWGTACSSLDDALARLPWATGGEVWLRAGNHRPTRAEGVILGPGTHVLGGFAGTETSAAQADPDAHPTTLDGDRLGNGAASAGDSWRILRVGDRETDLFVDDVVIRGLRLVGAYSQPSAQETGVVTIFGDVRIEDCEFIGNRTTAVRQMRGEVSVRRSAFVDNSDYSGAAISARLLLPHTYDGSLDVESCVFNGNRGVGGRGSALDLERLSSIRIDGSTFHANTAPSRPGAVSARNIASVWITNTVLHANSEAPPFAQEITRQISVNGAQSIVFQYNAVDDLSFVWNVNGNVVGAPGFVDAAGPDGTPGTDDDDLRLAAGSHAIDAGNSLYLRPWAQLDVAGEPRRRDDPNAPDTGVGGAPVVDIGAHER